MATGNKKSNFSIDIQTKAAEAKIKRLKDEVDNLTASLKKSGMTNSQYVETQNKLITAEKLLNKEIKSHTKLLNQDTVSHKNSINAIQQRINALRQEMNAMDMNSDKFKTASANMRQLSASMLEGSSATGLHAASAMELGRVFSDAPYGIRGVANNISQLGSLMAQAATTTDAATGKAIGMTGALKGLWKSLMGPLGILLAFQAAVAAVEYFSGKVSESKDELKSLSDEIASQTAELVILKKAMKDENVTQSQRIELVDDANRKYKDLSVAINEHNELTDDSVESIDKKIFALERLARANAIQAAIEVEMSKKISAELEVEQKLRETAFKNKEQALEFADGFNDLDNVGKRERINKFAQENPAAFKQGGLEAQGKIGEYLAALDAFEVVKKESDKKIDSLIAISTDGYEEIRDIINSPDPKSGGGRGKALKDFKDKIFDLEKFILGLDKEMVLSQEKNIRERLKLEQKYAEDELVLKKEAWIDSQRLRRDNFIASANSQAEIDDANRTFNKMVEQAEGEHMVALFKLKEKNVVDTKLMEEKIKREYDLASQKAALERASAELDLMNDLLDEKDPRALAVLQQKQRDVWALEDAAFEEDMARKLIKLEQEGIGLEEREFLIDQERMARIADRNNAEVDMEVAKIESIKAVRLEYIGWLSSIGSTMKKLSKDNEGLAKAAVIVEKSAATAKVIASTQAANAEIMQESGAAASKSIVQGQAAVAAGGILASNPVTAAMGAAQIAAGNASIAAAAPIAAGAKGRILKNNIGAGLAIANIWAESQAGGSSDTGGGSGGGGGNTFAPNFNVVGNSETNQLAESIGGQVNQPNRAYVVYEDIQNATELNANAVESSGI